MEKFMQFCNEHDLYWSIKKLSNTKYLIRCSTGLLENKILIDFGVFTGSFDDALRIIENELILIFVEGKTDKYGI